MRRYLFLADALHDLHSMTHRKAINEHPGRLPEIRTDGHSVTFEFDPARGEHGARLVVRCDEHGGVWSRIAADTDRD